MPAGQPTDGSLQSVWPPDRVRQRLVFIETLDRGALLDLAGWARVGTDGNPSNEMLVRDILRQSPDRFSGLSLRGLRLFAALRNVEVSDTAPREEIERLLSKSGRFWDAVRRKRRKIMGSLLEKALESATDELADPDGPSARKPEDGTIKKRVQDRGVVGGIAQTLRGVADDYVAEKLDEIERRIDAKLDEIDRRLGEWRDREISNRLKILKITLVFSILVAIVSLGYDYVRKGVSDEPQNSSVVQHVDE